MNVVSIMNRAKNSVPALLVVAGCAAPPASPADTLLLERIADHRWRVSYASNRAIRSLRFERPADFHREREWTIVTPGYEFRREGTDQVLALSATGVAADTLVVEFGEYTDPLPREYEAFVAFSDGGRALYTGHLYAAASDPPAPVTRFRTLRIHPPEDTRAVVRGRIHEDPFTLTTDGGGTYVYFGRTRPIESEHMVAIVDADLPPWLASRFADWIPRLFSLYATRFDLALPWKPVVLYGFEGAERSGLSAGGGALPGQVQLAVSGDGWLQFSPRAEESSLALIAHEAAHLWNGQIVRSAHREEGWMHEGSADAFARRVLLEFGVIDAEGNRQRVEGAINNCLDLIGNDPVTAATAQRASYDCGHLMAVWTERALVDADASTDLFGFWHELVTEATSKPAQDPTYDQALYFDVLMRLGVPDSVVRRMRSFVSEPGGDRVGMAIEGLAAHGVVLRPAGDAPRAYGLELARRAMAHLMGKACEGRVSFNSGPVIRTDAVDGCEPFSTPMEVGAMAGFAIASDGAALYDTVAEACDAGGNVALADASGRILSAVRCGDPLAPRRPWLRVSMPSGD